MEKNILTGNEMRFAKVRPNARIPEKDDENAGYDIYACLNDDDEFIELPAHSTTLVPTGIAAALSEDYYLQVHERGSTGSKGMKYSAGVVDSSYRGEIFVAISNINDHNIYIVKKEHVNKVEDMITVRKNNGIPGDKDAVIYPYEKAIAQLVVHRVHKMNIQEISYEELTKISSKRGTGALGSSGK